jgi:hypothetical protein
MKHLTLKNIGSSLVLIGGIATYGLASAHGDEHHDKASAATTTAATPAAKAGDQLPATAEGIWQAIDQKTAELDKTIQSGALKDVHHLAYAVRDLVAALPEKSKSLPADKQAKVKSGVKFVATLADRLDASGDANNRADAQAHYEKLMKILHGLRSDSSTPPAK